MSDFADYELIMVEDCGGDGSWELISELASSDSHVKGVKLSRNFGQHHAITAGMDVCTGDWVVVLDCDLQDDPAAIARLWAKAKEGYDVVNARRVGRKDSFLKRVRSKLFHMAFRWLSGLSCDPRVANFRIMSRKVVDAYNTMRETSRALGVQVHWLGYPTASIDVPHASRHDGKTSYTVRKLLALALDIAIAYSSKPLRIAIILGFVIAVCSMGIGLWLLVRYGVLGIPVPGWTSLMVSVWCLGGIIIATLGVIGVYVGKIYDETKRRPIYVIEKTLNL
jgi:dolichol-phosphate mannosyltransferase